MANTLSDPTGPEPVRVAGLLIPAALAPRIIAALRWRYPQLTADKDDEAAVRATLIDWITENLLGHNEHLASLQKLTAYQKVDDAFAGQLAEVKAQVEALASTITEAPSGDAEPTVPTV